MRLGEIEFPDKLLDALHNRKLVIFAGAGVSMDEPANLKGFADFAKEIARGSGETKSSDETEDQFLGRLQYRKNRVHKRAARILSQNNPQPTGLHYNLLKVFSESSHVRVVTTNFDTLFEQAAKDVLDSNVKVYDAPALPLGSDFEGIVHVHGSICEPNNMVLTDADFGRAYIVEGWASRFLAELFESFTVLFVGYSYNDVVMKYLTRSLTPSRAAKRFILVKEGGKESWGEFGISPIEFRNLKEDKYRVLYKGVKSLAVYANRSFVEWQSKITELAQNPPPNCSESDANELLAEALSILWRARVFSRAALDPGWIEWLDKKKYLENLFDSRGEPLSPIDLRLSYWLSETFALNHADELFLLISRHQMNLHPQFWTALGGTIAMWSGEDVKPEVLSRWASLLLAYSHNDRSGYVLHQLGLKCAESGLTDSLVEIFSTMSEPKLVICQGIDTPFYRSSFRVRTETTFRFSHNRLRTVWSKGLKPNLPEVVDSVLVSTVATFSTIYRTFRSWHPEDYDEDHVSASRLDLESGNSEPVDVLIDATRDCLAYLSANRPESALEWCNQLIDSGVPILRRLSLYAFTRLEHDGITPDAKLEWLLQTVGIYFLAAEGETVAFLQALYPQASDRVRQSIVNSVLSHNENWSNLSLEENERLNSSLHLRWLEVLNAADSTCSFVQDAINAKLEDHPELREVRHTWTERRSYRSGPILFPRRPTVHELLQRSAQTLSNELSLRLEQVEPGVVRDNTLDDVREAAKISPQWGLELAESLAEAGDWNTVLWMPLLASWSQEANQSFHADILRLLSSGEVGHTYPNSVARVLLTLVDGSGVPHAFSLLTDANQLAGLLWSSSIEAEVPSDLKEDDWLSDPLEHPAGTLAKFWIQSLSIWYEQQDPKPSSLPYEYMAALSTILGDDTLAGQVGLIALTERVQLLMDVDQGWCLDNLIPVLWQSDSHKYRFAWHGLTPINLGACVADKLQDAFLHAASNLNELFPVDTKSLFQPDNQLRKSFICSYLELMNFTVDDPVMSWVPRLLNSFRIEEDWRHFAFDVRNRLIELNDEGQCDLWEDWLGEYWESRLDNVPYELNEVEVQGMLNWLPYFRSKFPEATEYAIRMPRHETDPDELLGCICDNGMWEEYPEETLKLLSYLAQSESIAYSMHIVRELVTKLTALDLADDQKSELDELAILLGLELR